MKGKFENTKKKRRSLLSLTAVDKALSTAIINLSLSPHDATVFMCSHSRPHLSPFFFVVYSIS